jgi:hypothetical protein
MSRFRRKLTPFNVFAIAFILYFSGHMIYGYFYCQYSEFANCPGIEALFADEEETSDDKN